LSSIFQDSFHFKSFFYFCQSFLKKILFEKNSEKMAHNVPVVYDVFAARIRACVARPGLQKCGGGLPWEWSEAE
jgi:hypothetical protein